METRKKQDLAQERLRRKLDVKNKPLGQVGIMKDVILRKVTNDSPITLIFWASMSFAQASAEQNYKQLRKKPVDRNCHSGLL